jgi:energy-coupling factor transporter transmembrane protein EcfT
MAGAAVLILAGAFSTGLGPRPLLAGSAPLVIILLVFAVFRAASIDDGQSGIDITRFTLDQSVLLSGLQMAAGILLCFTAGSLFFAVTTTMEIRNFLSRLELFLLRPFYKSKPQSQGRLSLSLALMLGFLPRFFFFF